MQLHDPDRLAVRLAREAAARAVAPGPGSAAWIPVGAPTAAVAAALRWTAEGPKVLLMRRAEHPGDPWSGQVSLPGGRSEPEDVDLVGTARRETREELGLELGTEARLLGALAPIQAMARGKRLGLYVQPFVFEVAHEPALALNHEVSATFWLPLDPAARGELAHRHSYQDERRSLLLPAWRYDEQVVWGLTYRMLAGLVGLAVPSPEKRPT